MMPVKKKNKNIGDKNMKAKIGVLFLVLMVGMAAVGASYALWAKTITLTGTVATGDVDIQFSNAITNDAENPGQLDEKEFGSWTFGNIDDPATWSWTGNRYDKNVAWCDVSGAPGYTLSLTAGNTYPSYYCSAAFSVDNIGSIPVKINGLKLTEISKDGSTFTLNPSEVLVAGTQYYVDWETKTISTTLDPLTHDFSIRLSELALNQQIGAEGSTDDSIPGDIGFHIEQAAAQKSIYDFKVEISGAQWNEVP